MKFDKILEYQKADLELMALESEVAKSEQRQKLAGAKAKLDAATDTVGKLKQEASELLASFAQMKDKIDALKGELDEFDGILDDVQDETEADYYIKNVSAIADKIAALEKEANGAASKIDQVNENYKKTWDQGVKANEAYKAAKAEYDALVKTLQPKVVEIQKQLVTLKGEVPPKMMEAYMALRGAKKMPAVVEYDKEAAICGRCRMEVPNDTKAKLRNPGDFAECPNCRRILYVPDAE